MNEHMEKFQAQYSFYLVPVALFPHLFKRFPESSGPHNTKQRPAPERCFPLWDELFLRSVFWRAGEGKRPSSLRVRM